MPPRFASRGERLAACFFLYSLWILWITLFTVQTGQSAADWVNGWVRWDSDWYIRIWNEGYFSDPKLLVFPPGFPWAAGSVSRLLGASFAAGAMAMNLVAYFFASFLSAEFLYRRFRFPWWAVFLSQLMQPVAFYAFASYSDALFACGFWAALSFAAVDPRSLTRGGRYALRALLFFLPWVRLTGFALLVWALFRRWSALLVVVPLALYLLLNRWMTGDWFYFLHAQRDFLMPDGGFLTGLRYHSWELLRPPMLVQSNSIFWMQVTFLPLVSSALILVAVAWLAKKREWMLAATMLAIALFSRNQAYWRSVLRYDWPLTALMLAPWFHAAFGVTGAAGRMKAVRIAGRIALALLLVIGLILQTEIARRLHQGGWAY